MNLWRSGAGHTPKRLTTGARIGRRCRRPTPRSASIDTISDERRNIVDYHEIEDEHDDRLRHGEAHLEGRGEWQDGFFFEGVERDGQDSERAVNTGDRPSLAEGASSIARCGHDAGVPGAGGDGSIASGQGRDCVARSPRRWRDILWRIIRRKRGA